MIQICGKFKKEDKNKCAVINGKTCCLGEKKLNVLENHRYASFFNKFVNAKTF